MGIVDALGEGFRLVFRRPLLLLIPVLIDFLLQAFPGLSVRDLLLARVGPGADLSGLPPVVLSPLLTFFIPSTVGFGGGGQLRGSEPVELESVGGALLVAGIFIVLGMVIAAAYMGSVAGSIRGEIVRAGMLAYVLGRFPRLLGLTLAVVGALAAALALLMLVISTVPLLGQLLVMVEAVAFFSVLFVLFFAVIALMVEDVGIRESVERSLRLLRTHAGPASLFIVTTSLINLGLGLIWIKLVDSAPGLMLAIVANALVGTAIAAGSMFFYLTRAGGIESEELTPGPGA